MIALVTLTTILAFSASTCRVEDGSTFRNSKNHSLLASALVRGDDLETTILSAVQAISSIIDKNHSSEQAIKAQDPVGWLAAVSLLIILGIKLFKFLKGFRNQDGPGHGDRAMQ